ncbi:hypothetical protein [Microbacterium phyllosphaerae]|uniref:hypothetical protein n=1 Tax=Microbacterium phyllosphaerae TaxID=124798 RepID=UPI002167690A|nr:hypothetical protein [Microbacterium phyllosphaerae]MCS3442813.1 hypothetical protein [Microbacterium phyllosphaerae]
MDSVDFPGLFAELIEALEAPNVADWITVGATILTLVVAVFALTYARGQVAEAQSARRQARELERERSQPYVVAYTEPSGATPTIIDLVVRNYGATAAQNVRLELDPWPVRSDGTADGERIAVPDPIPVLAPGQEWRTMWDSASERGSSAHPDRHVGLVRYEGIDRESRKSEVVLDWAVYKTRRWVQVYGEHDSAKALREMRGVMKKWSESIHGSLSVYVRDGHAKDEARRAQFEAFQAGGQVSKARPRRAPFPRPRVQWHRRR